MSVPGETRVRFRIRATTIMDGPYTAYRYGNIPAYPPAIAPRNVRSTKFNETTFIVAWQPLPRDQSNGVVTKYEVTWQRMRITNRRRRSLESSVTASTLGSQYTIYNLKLCAQYTVYVKGFTKAGPGPNSTVVIVTSQPGKPTDVQAQSPTKTSITVRWEKPLPVSLVVDEYKIDVKGSKSYWPQFSFSKTYKQNGAQTNMVIEDLVPGTSYEFWVTASTACGKSEKSVSSRRDTDIDKPAKPDGNSVALKDRFNVTLWPVDPINGPISSYQVIVLQGNKDESDLPPNISDYKDGKELYITAELKPNELKSSFPVGDNEKYGKYKNIPLDKGKTYTIAERAITYQGKLFAGQAAVVATIEITQDPTKYSNSTIWALEGDEVTIGCYTSGHEPITYIWTKTGSLLVADSPSVKIRGNNLIISLKSDKEFGTYVCTATNSDRTIIYRINRVELKKRTVCNKSEKSESKANEVVIPYVIPLVLVILGLIICIVYLVYRLRREKQYNEKNMNTKTDETGIMNDVMVHSNHQDGNITNSRRPENAKSDEIESPGYMELQPRQISDTLYQSIQEPASTPGKNETSNTQDMSGHEQYMDLKPRLNAEYETLHHKNDAPGQDYEVF